MEEHLIDVNELIKVESLPKIFYQLEEIGKKVDEALVDIEDMECTDENKQEVKKRKQEITAFKNLMEDRRKEIKNQILEKYNEFNDKYELEVKSKLVNAENILNEKVSNIEVQQKLDKENELRAFYQEYVTKYNLEDMEIPFETIGLNITLTASMKSLKEKIVAFCEKIANDLKLIELEEYKDEIMLEFRSSLNFANAKMRVVGRHKELELIKRTEEERARKKEEESKIVEKVEEVVEPEIVAPIEIETTTLEDTEEQFIVSFTVKATKEVILKLKQCLEELKKEGLEYV